MLYTSDYFVNLLNNFKATKNYFENKKAVQSIAWEYQNSYSYNVVYYMSEISYIEKKLELLARRYGLLREFKENAII